jgi:hypothetical protein
MHAYKISRPNSISFSYVINNSKKLQLLFKFFKTRHVQTLGLVRLGSRLAMGRWHAYASGLLDMTSRLLALGHVFWFGTSFVSKIMAYTRPMN